MKRKWLMVPIVTGLLAVGLTGATVLANHNGGEQESPKDAVATKVAEILGIEDTQSVKDALTEATREVRSERLQHRMDQLVEAGRLTQEQANAYVEWYEARPEGVNIHGHRGFGGGHRFGGPGFHGQGQPPAGSGSEAPQGTGTSL